MELDVSLRNVKIKIIREVRERKLEGVKLGYKGRVFLGKLLRLYQR